jgi:hypothetical protein
MCECLCVVDCVRVRGRRDAFASFIVYEYRWERTLAKFLPLCLYAPQASLCVAKFKYMSCLHIESYARPDVTIDNICTTGVG